MILPSPADAKASGIPSEFYADIKIPIRDQKDSPLPSPNGSILLPRYSQSRRPSANIRYTFKPLPSNCMLLAPPDVPTPDCQKPYHITVNMNCFTPTSYITSVRKQTWDGEEVGDFELGATRSGSPGTILLRGNEYTLPDVLTEVTNSSRSAIHFKTWRWEVKSIQRQRPLYLYWDDHHGGGVLTVYSSDDRNESNLLARFTPRTTLRRKGQPAEPPSLVVSPLGHDLFDDILLGALIIERLRTTPT
uniref:Uncharacterized protein n=1 Tax=Mycena chlorophos TaxID=658473 RepID=A0ABQ0M845_MYCCL|nr:predicted protein [Mycena chlorophos]